MYVRLRAAAGRARRLIARVARSVRTPALLTFPTVLEPPCPPGWTESQLLETMQDFAVDDTAPGDLKPYADDAFWRFLHTWGLVRELEGTALELGANPYFTSFLIQDFTDLDLTLANYFGTARGPAIQELRWTEPDGTPRSRQLPFDQFNLEEDEFPYADASFDVVLFCEILEHLLMDPLHAFREIHRVLKPNGRLVVTTPNVARMENVLAMISGTNIYDPYSGFGPYGRHNREYTMHDLVQLLTFAGFTVEQQFSADAYPASPPYETRLGYAAVAPQIAFREHDLGHYLFVVARATAPPRDGLPAFLYRSYPADQIVAPD